MDALMWAVGVVLAMSGLAALGMCVLLMGDALHLWGTLSRMGEADAAPDDPAVVVRPSGASQPREGHRLRWEPNLALHAVQRDSTARLERRKREREADIHRAVNAIRRSR